MPRTAICRWNRMTTMRWCNCKAIRSPTALRWGRRRIGNSSPKAPTVGTLQTLPPDEESLGGTPSSGSDRVAKEAGFSLHAGVSTEAHQRDKLERLCRYVTRPAVSEKRLALTSNGNIRYQPGRPR
jgi:hypothetical protein